VLELAAATVANKFAGYIFANYYRPVSAATRNNMMRKVRINASARAFPSLRASSIFQRNVSNSSKIPTFLFFLYYVLYYVNYVAM